MNKTALKILNIDDFDQILQLGCELNPEKPKGVIQSRLREMFEYPNYICFGLYLDQKLVGISSGWISTRFYSGKQLEIDNVIITKALRSKGFGEIMLAHIEKWAHLNDCLSLELNAYVSNERSHKFYFNQDYRIIGYHFQKKLYNSK